MINISFFSINKMFSFVIILKNKKGMIMSPIIPAAAIASAHVAANTIRNNMQRGSLYDGELSYKDRHLIAVQNALLQTSTTRLRLL